MARGHKNKPKRERAGAPAPDKDRTRHLAARGVKTGKKATLSHLTKNPLTSEEFEAALNMMRKESDRGAAIMGAALVEEALTTLIETHLQVEGQPDELFFDQGAPFATLRGKTVLVRAFKLIDDALLDGIDTIRAVRNQFSHSLRPLDFRHPEISAYTDRLASFVPEKYREAEKDEKDVAASRFVWEMATQEVWILTQKKTNSILRSRIPPPPNALAALFGRAPSGTKSGPKDVKD